MDKAEIGIYGLGVMGRNLALNMEQNGYTVSLFNRTVPGKEEDIVESFLKDEGKDKNFVGTYSEDTFITSLRKPRKILLMVKAGKPVDKVISQLSTNLEPGDILIDGGNSHYRDTIRRVEELEKKNILFIGMGVSGGEEGARFGPSLMPGGSSEAWKEVDTILNNIAAKDGNGKSCCSWIGKSGAGHFTKMVHNGIEYADMQLIAECYHIMKVGLGIQAQEMAEVFYNWNQGSLNSYLLEITSGILKTEAEDGSPLIDKILDTAGQKGTGLWTAVAALESGVALPVITSAVFGRVLSSFKALRKELSDKLEGIDPLFSQDKNAVLNNLEQALLAGRIITLGEGFFLIQQVSNEYEWSIDLAEVARIWQNGCIIRSKLLAPVMNAYQEEPKLKHLLVNDTISGMVADAHQELRQVVLLAVEHGIPCPGMSSALAQYDSIRSEWLPANMIQAQRDYFGAHQYERIDKPRGTFFHTDWTSKNKKT